jgi:hypothetical protein
MRYVLLTLALVAAPAFAQAPQPRDTFSSGAKHMHRQSEEEKERFSVKQKPARDKPKAERDRLNRAEQLRNQLPAIAD